ncbi:MAG: GNAT family N-acetyltransferase [Oscillospiraceae bacterium]|nr:GNAT family N-acetyltransferase [Oscillospiraceae bacterium]
MKYTIRKAEIDDARLLAEIKSKSWAAAYKELIPANLLEKHSDIEYSTERFTKIIKNRELDFHIAFDAQIPCGHFTFCKSRDEDLPDFAEVAAFYAIPDYWGKGVGREMILFALQKISDLGYKNVLLWTLKENRRARLFYEKFGFKLDGKEKENVLSNELIEVRYTFNINHQK